MGCTSIPAANSTVSCSEKASTPQSIIPGAVATEALAINNWPIPAIAGDYADAAGRVHGFVYIGGQFLPVNAAFAQNLSVTGINDLGEMAGIYDLGGQLGTAQTFGFQGFAGLLTPLNYPDHFNRAITTSTLFHSLNNKGEIAGTARIQFPELSAGRSLFGRREVTSSRSRPGWMASWPTMPSASMTPGSWLAHSRI